jgi:hypothetical protein
MKTHDQQITTTQHKMSKSLTNPMQEWKDEEDEEGT